MTQKPRTSSIYGGMTGALKRSAPGVTQYAEGEVPPVALVESSAHDAMGSDAPGEAPMSSTPAGAVPLSLSAPAPRLTSPPSERPGARAPRAVPDSVAKRNNKDLTQMSTFVKKKVHKRVKIRLAEREDMDLSDLVNMLLERWLEVESK